MTHIVTQRTVTPKAGVGELLEKYKTPKLRAQQPLFVPPFVDILCKRIPD